MCAVSNEWRTGMISLGLVGYADAQAEGRTRGRPLMTLTARSSLANWDPSRDLPYVRT